MNRQLFLLLPILLCFMCGCGVSIDFGEEQKKNDNQYSEYIEIGCLNDTNCRESFKCQKRMCISLKLPDTIDYCDKQCEIDRHRLVCGVCVLEDKQNWRIK